MKNKARISIRTSQEQKDRLDAIADRLKAQGIKTSSGEIARGYIDKGIKADEKQVKKLEKR